MTATVRSPPPADRAAEPAATVVARASSARLGAASASVAIVVNGAFSAERCPSVDLLEIMLGWGPCP